MTQRAPRKVKSVRMYVIFRDGEFYEAHSQLDRANAAFDAYTPGSKHNWTTDTVTYPIRPVKEKWK